MAVSDQPQGYLCAFIDPIPDKFYCKRCSLVAKRLSFTSCCWGRYCRACIVDIQQNAKPCPTCGNEAFITYERVGYQQRIECLWVYCNMKERGCGWEGTLEQLDIHLDPDRGNCQHVDIKCPLTCQQTVAKIEMAAHVSKECVKRDFALQLQHKLENKEKKLQEQEQKLQEQELKLQEQEQKFQEQEQQLQDKEKMLREQGQKLQNLFREQIEPAHTEVSIKRRFEMKNFSGEKTENIASEWKSPPMWTHWCGYKFCIGIDPNGFGDAQGKAMQVELWAVKGEYDDQLKWPAHASFSLELLNPKEEKTVECTLVKKEWKRPESLPCEKIYEFDRKQVGSCCAFAEHDELDNFLHDDTLVFQVTSTVIFT